MLREISRENQTIINSLYLEALKISKQNINEKVLEIKRLQEEARTLQSKSYRLLEEADSLAKEVRNIGGDRFVCNGIPYMFEYKARQAYENVPGNRYWLRLDTTIKIIE